MMLNLGELVHNLSYWLSETFLQCAACFLPNCVHFAFPRTGRKDCFQVQKLENEDWSCIEEMAKGEEEQKGLSRKGTTHSHSGCITLVEIKNNMSIQSVLQDIHRQGLHQLYVPVTEVRYLCPSSSHIT